MRTFRVNSLISVAAGLAIACALVTPLAAQDALAPVTSAPAETALDAALGMANMLDGAGGGISGSDLISVLEEAAAEGQPAALWQLGLMYENGEGVQQEGAEAGEAVLVGRGRHGPLLPLLRGVRQAEPARAARLAANLSRIAGARGLSGAPGP